MANSNSIQLHQSLPFPSPLSDPSLINEHEKKSCSLASLSADSLLLLNGLTIHVRICFPSDRVLVGRVLAVLIHADQSSPPEVLFLEDGSESSDFLDSKETFLIGAINSQ